MAKKETVKQIKNILNSTNNKWLVGLVGSATESDTFDDLDFLLLTDNIDLTISDLCKEFKNFTINKIDDALKIIGFCEYEISIAIYDLKKVFEIVNNFVTGKRIICEHRSWALGYWMPEAFIYDLSRIYIIKDCDNQFLNIKNKLQNYSFYARNKIILDCIEEMELKKAMFEKTLSEIEKNIIISDIILCIIRGYKAINYEYLKGFKNLNNLIDTLPNDLVQTIDNIFNKNISLLNDIIDLYKTYVSWNNKLYLGTWQFGGDFKKFNNDEIFDIINHAKEMGIKNFDTALVYGNGNVEKILGKILTSDNIVVTKIPAKVKPNMKEISELQEYYTEDYIFNCVKDSLKNLNRDKIDIVLLHNWIEVWNDENLLIDWLLKLKDSDIVKRIGISLPNHYNSTIPINILEKIDVIEAPYNVENNWILKDLDLYKSFNIEIILRSLFMQGKVLANEENFKYAKIIEKASQLGTSLVIGMTTKEQIEKNIKILKGE